MVLTDDRRKTLMEKKQAAIARRQAQLGDKQATRALCVPYTVVEDEDEEEGVGFWVTHFQNFG